MINKVSLEKSLFQIEQKLNNWSVIPFLGSVPAVTKACLGALQFISALVVAILSALPALCNNEAKDLFLYCWVHMKHGVVNFISGLAMAIPFTVLIAYVMTGGRMLELHVDVGQDFHFMPYPNHALKEGRLRSDYHHVCGVLAWTFDEEDDFSPLFEGMSAEEALNIGLIKSDLEVDEGALGRIREQYDADEIKLRGMLKSERLKEIEEHRQVINTQKSLKIRAGLSSKRSD